MAEVYWIRKTSHTDIFTEGYVGVTSKTAQDRYKEHLKQSRVPSSVKTILHKVIKALGADELVCETVCICELDYAFDLENKLRPSEMIGWNQIVGGSSPPNRKGQKFSEEHRNNISKGLKGLPASEAKLAHIQSIADRKKGKQRPDGATEKQLLTILNKGPWNNPAAKDKREFWEKADIYYSYFLDGKGAVRTAKEFGLTESNLFGIFRNFKNGWVPINDERWLSEFNKMGSIYGS